jgi:hypothetical protein
LPVAPEAAVAEAAGDTPKTGGRRPRRPGGAQRRAAREAAAETPVVQSEAMAEADELTALFDQLNQEAKAVQRSVVTTKYMEKRARAARLLEERLSRMQSAGPDYYQQRKFYQRHAPELQAQREAVLASPNDEFVVSRRKTIDVVEGRIAAGRAAVDEMKEKLAGAVRENDRTDLRKKIEQFEAAIGKANIVVQTLQGEIDGHLRDRLAAADKAIADLDEKMRQRHAHAVDHARTALDKLRADTDLQAFIANQEANRAKEVAEQARIEAEQKEAARQVELVKKEERARKQKEEARKAWLEQAQPIEGAASSILGRIQTADTFWNERILPKVKGKYPDDMFMHTTMSGMMRAYRDALTEDEKQEHSHAGEQKGKSGTKGSRSERERSASKPSDRQMQGLRSAITKLIQDKVIGITDLQKLVPWVADAAVARRDVLLRDKRTDRILKEGIHYGETAKKQTSPATGESQTDPADERIRSRAAELQADRERAIEQLEFFGRLFGKEMHAVVVRPGGTDKKGRWHDAVIDIVGGLANTLPESARPKRPEAPKQQGGQKNDKGKQGGASGGRTPVFSPIPSAPPAATGGGMREVVVPTIDKETTPNIRGNAGAGGDNAGRRGKQGMNGGNEGGMPQGVSARDRVVREKTQGERSQAVRVRAGDPVFSDMANIVHCEVQKGNNKESAYQWTRRGVQITFRVDRDDPESITVLHASDVTHINAGAQMRLRQGGKIAVADLKMWFGDKVQVVKRFVDRCIAQKERGSDEYDASDATVTDPSLRAVHVPSGARPPILGVVDGASLSPEALDAASDFVELNGEDNITVSGGELPSGGSNPTKDAIRQGIKRKKGK